MAAYADELEFFGSGQTEEMAFPIVVVDIDQDHNQQREMRHDQS